MIEFKVPKSMNNDELEKLIIAIEEALENRGFGPFVPEVIDESIQKHGKKAVFRVIGSYFVDWVIAVSYEIPPDETEYKDRAKEFLGADKAEEAADVLKSYRWDHARYLGQVVSRCEYCDKVRHGRDWLPDYPTPDGWVSIGSSCPECDNLGKNKSPEQVITDDELRAWLAEEVEV